MVIKAEPNCGSHNFVMYQASSGSLPSTLDDGRTHLGNAGAGAHTVRVEEVEYNRHVTIHLRYVDATVVIRQVGFYFNVAVKMPEALVKAALLDNPDRIDLCQKGCPRAERIDYMAILAHKNRHAKRSVVPAQHGMALDAAQRRCRDAQLVDFYLDSCVFDLVTTGDRNFTRSARLALEDLYELYPDGVKLHHNRTSLDFSRVRTATSAAARSSLYVGYTSNLQYLHRTTYVLLLALLTAALSQRIHVVL